MYFTCISSLSSALSCYCFALGNCFINISVVFGSEGLDLHLVADAGLTGSSDGHLPFLRPVCGSQELLRDEPSASGRQRVYVMEPGTHITTPFGGLSCSHPARILALGQGATILMPPAASRNGKAPACYTGKGVFLENIAIRGLELHVPQHCRFVAEHCRFRLCGPPPRSAAQMPRRNTQR